MTFLADGDAPIPSDVPSTPDPIKRIRIKPANEADRPRAGGHVLTDRGWVPEATHQEK